MSPSGLQKYRCRGCGRSFTVISDTIFDLHRIPVSEWVDFLRNLFSFQSFNSISKNNRNSFSTTKYWLDKVFLVARGFHDDMVLDGTVYIDETFYSVVEGKKVRDGTGKEPRGLSRNKYCIGTMSDAKGRIYLKSEGKRGKPSCASTLDCYLGPIGAGSTVVHDGEKSHRRLIRELDLREQVFPSKETRGLAGHGNPMDRINSVHRLLKKIPQCPRRLLQG
jgi:hypothetical protein